MSDIVILRKKYPAAIQKMDNFFKKIKWAN